MDFRALQEKTKDLTPNLPIKANGIWVAVLHHSKKPENVKEENDFLWLKCNKKITLGTVKAEYGKKNPIDVVLKHRDTIPGDLVQMGDLNYYNDNIIVFRALEATSMEAQQQPITRSPTAGRQPLQPTNAQLTVKPSASPAESLKSPQANGRQEPPSTSAIPSADLAGTRAQMPPAVQNENVPPSGVAPTRAVHHPMPSVSPLKRKVPFVDQAADGTNPSASRIKREVSVDKAASEGRDVTASPLKREPSVGDAAAEGSNASSEEPTKSEAMNPFEEEGDDLVRGGDESGASQNASLQKLSAEACPEILEAGVEKGVQFLNELRAPLADESVDSQDAKEWLKQIDSLEKQAVRTRTVVGVVGNTGAGKSSVINAMLDEERLVPTNCMRACTAVVTELSWNESNDPDSRYGAEIEFIKATDWEKELRILFDELLDGNGNVSRDCANADSEAGVAYAKIKAVYPKKTKEDLAKSSIESLMGEITKLNVLGTTKRISKGRPEPFYRELQQYVDSKEKATDSKKDKEKDKAKKPREVEFWPLIKVVKIYVKAAALSTGAVVVDLPGVHDSNAARAAVADGYMKQCTGLWIVAPINRAVDDKAAKSLLGESFKRQLKLDGTYSSVTFICSKTDDISVTEAVDSLDMAAEMTKSQEELDNIKRQQHQVKEKLKTLEEAHDVYAEVFTDTDAKCDQWENLQAELSSGKTVYAPSKSKKPKLPEKTARQRKKRRTSSDSDSEENSEDADYEEVSDGEDETAADDEESGEPLTGEVISAKINELREHKKNARRQKQEMKKQIEEAKKELEGLKAAADMIDNKMRGECIAGRNAYSKGAIQRDFAAGIKELDQENAAEEEEENFNPDEDLRDYEEVARTMPVFCVSSRAYQKLSGRLEREAPVPGFNAPEETEIPQLQAHCRKLTEAGRAATCRRFLNGLIQLVNSLSLWASDQVSGIKLSDAERSAETKFLISKLGRLEKGLESAVRDSVEDIKETFSENIFEKFEPAAKVATEHAVAAYARWHSPVNRDDRRAGGYPWASYKAIVRRNGVFSNSHGLHDFNAELTEPIYKALASGWEKAFARRIPHVLQGFTRACSRLLKQFHQAIETRSRQHGSGFAGLMRLGQQLQAYEAAFDGLAGRTVEEINTMQRDVNRGFTPVVEAAMAAAYEWCAAEVGPGQYARMKTHMTSHIEEQRHKMFGAATQAVQGYLQDLCRQIEEKMANQADDVFVIVRRDYMTVLGGATVSDDKTMPKAERSLKERVRCILEASELKFREVVEGGKESEPAVDWEDVKEEAENKHDAPAEEDEVMKDGEGDEIDLPAGADILQYSDQD